MVRTRPFSVGSALLVCLCVLGVGPLSDELGPAAADELTVDEARRQLGDAQAATRAAEDELTAVRAERRELTDRLDQRDRRRQRAVADLRVARRDAHEFAVAAYIGNEDRDAVILGDAVGATDYLYSQTLLRDSSAARDRAARYFQGLRAQADEAVTATLDQIDTLDRRIAEAEAAVNRAVDREREAAVAVGEAEQRAEARAEAERAAREAAAQAEADARAATQAPVAGSPAPTPSGGWQPIGTLPGGPTPAQWAALRQCESGGNYQAVNPSGKYRGAYQFDLATWQTVGGSGDPAAASPAEQDHRAQLLYASRGRYPWPVCGRHLI